ncbi:hypothetical protein LY78DRAFT_663700 [Colletotrichum sublineola]|nr:hypothetical protein LY78DRAFT_663700 [Colletotrichum sublineola]
MPRKATILRASVQRSVQLEHTSKGNEPTGGLGIPSSFTRPRGSRVRTELWFPTHPAMMAKTSAFSRSSFLRSTEEGGTSWGGEDTNQDPQRRVAQITCAGFRMPRWELKSHPFSVITPSRRVPGSFRERMRRGAHGATRGPGGDAASTADNGRSKVM